MVSYMTTVSHTTVAHFFNVLMVFGVTSGMLTIVMVMMLMTTCLMLFHVVHHVLVLVMLFVMFFHDFSLANFGA
jgi:hypothetical protein